MDEKRVAIAVANQNARRLAVDAVRQFGATPIPLDKPGDLLSVSRVCSGSVCDLHTLELTAPALQSLRLVDPAHPVLIVVQLGQEQTFQEIAQGDMGVRCCIATSDEGLTSCLTGNIEWLMQYHPVDALLKTMVEGFPPPSNTTMRFLEWSIRAIHAGVVSPVTVGARDLGVSPRTLARHLRDDRMPAPIELFGWAKLLAVSHRCDLNKTSLAAAARTFNIDAGRLYQLRRRLMRKTRFGGFRSDRPVFSFVLQAFRERCAALQGELSGSITQDS